MKPGSMAARAPVQRGVLLLRLPKAALAVQPQHVHSILQRPRHAHHAHARRARARQRPVLKDAAHVPRCRGLARRACALCSARSTLQPPRHVMALTGACMPNLRVGDMLEPSSVQPSGMRRTYNNAVDLPRLCIGGVHRHLQQAWMFHTRLPQ